VKGSRTASLDAVAFERSRYRFPNPRSAPLSPESFVGHHTSAICYEQASAKGAVGQNRIDMETTRPERGMEAGTRNSRGDLRTMVPTVTG
jgi:hypothetical protein